MKTIAGQAEGNQLSEAVARSADGANGAVIFDRGGLESQPVEDHQISPVRLAEFHEGIHHAARDEAEGAELRVNRISGDQAQQAKIQAAAEVPDRRPKGRLSFGEDDIEPLSSGCHKLLDRLRRILQIAIHEDDVVAARLLQPGDDGGLLAEIARQPAGDHMRVAFGELLQDGPRLVRASIVDEDDLILLSQGGQNAAQPFMQGLKGSAAAIDRDHDAEVHAPLWDEVRFDGGRPHRRFPAFQHRRSDPAQAVARHR